MKRIKFGALLSAVVLLVVVSLEMPVSASKNVVKGDAIILNNYVYLNGNGFVITKEGKPELGEGSVLTYPEKEKVRKFEHELYDRNGDFLGVLNVLVKGIYSEAEHYAEIKGVATDLVTYKNNGLSVERRMSGDKAYVYVKAGGVAICTITYTLHTNGNIGYKIKS